MAKKKLVDAAQKLYAEKDKSLDIDRDVDNFAMWAFWLAISTPFLIFFPFINFFFPLIVIAIIVLSAISLFRISKDKKLKGRGFAITALIIGTLELMVMIFLILILMLGVGLGLTSLFSAFGMK